MTEPNPEKHYIFYSWTEAWDFYQTLTYETASPRQSHGGTWIIDKEEK